MVELELTEFLAQGPKSTADIAKHCNLSESATLVLLRALKSLSLLIHYEPNWWSLDELGAAMLANPGISAMVHHHKILYQDLIDPVAMLRDRSNSQLAQFWNYQPDEEAQKTSYSELMARSQSMIADYVLDRVDLSAVKNLMDIAGGTGAFASSVAQRWPNISVSVLDLPQVVAEASHRVANDCPITFLAGDMFSGPLPRGRDCISLVRVLHDHDDGPVQNLLNRVHAALDPGGSIIIAEPMAETPGAEAIGGSYFGFYLWTMGSGRARTVAELSGMLRQAGFTDAREIKTGVPSLVRVITAQKKSVNFV